MNAEELSLQDLFGRWRGRALIVGACGLALCLPGAIFSARQFFYSYLFGCLFWTGLALGCFGWLMIHHLTGGGWGFLIRRFLEAGVMTLPLLALLFVPLLFGLGQLYAWAQPGAAHVEAARQRHVYMNMPLFTLRLAAFFGLWTALAWWLNRCSFAQAATADPQPTRRLRAVSGPGLVFYALSVTFAYIDWVMALEPRWYSSIFTIQVIMGQMLTALAFATALLARLRGRAPWRDVIRPEHYRTLGSLLLAFVCLWTYMSLSQLIIIWSGNLPREIGWYLHRTAGGWKWIAVFLALFHFFVPFFLLLSRDIKQRVGALAAIAAGLFVVHAVEVFWMIAPSLHQQGLWISWMDPAALAGVGGLWLAAFLWLLGRAPLMPRNDPRLEPDLTHGH